MYLGGYQIGGIVPLLVWTRDANGTPTVPDTAPLATIWRGTLKIEDLRLSVAPSGLTGLFLYPLFLGDTDYATGKHFVAYEYELSGNKMTGEACFEIADGGHFDGQGLSIHFLRQPGGDFVLQQTRSGRVLRRKNPSV